MDIDTSIFKSYDIRGIFPDNLNNEIAYKIGQAYVYVVKPKGEVVVGEDVRLHSHELKESLIRGIVDAGIDVLDVGLILTDMLYFAVGFYKKEGGIQTTASHNPREWHGFKMVKKGPKPITYESGISLIKNFVLKGKKIMKNKEGKVRKKEIWDDYCKYILSFIKNTKVKPMKVVINPNFGPAGIIFEKIVERGKLPLKIISLNKNLDGSFPKGKPDPFIPENRKEFVDLVKSTKADLGITWDADGDRVFFATDAGTFVEPYYLNTILIKEMLKGKKGEKVIYDPRFIFALDETIRENGGIPIRVRVGHSYIKEAMKKYNALFAAESSGHTYYRDYWYSDCGMIPVMQILRFLSTNNIKLSEAVKPIMNKYFISGEINSEIKNKDEKIKEISKKYQKYKKSFLDGISVEAKDWRFCVRPSNTEPLLRLTVEAKSKKLLSEKTKEVLRLIRN